MSIKHREGVIFVRFVIQAFINEYKSLANDFTSIQKAKVVASPRQGKSPPTAVDSAETSPAQEQDLCGVERERRVVAALIQHTVARALDLSSGWLGPLPLPETAAKTPKEKPMAAGVDVGPETEEEQEEEPLDTVSEDERLMSCSDEEKGENNKEKEREKTSALPKRLGKSASEGNMKMVSGNQSGESSVESRIERELDRSHERTKESMKQRRENLEAEKKMLKRRLKEFDDVFEKKHGRKPQRVDKEPIRHLYEAYNAVKILLSKEQQIPSMKLTAKSVQSLLNEKRQLQGKLRRFEREFEEKHSRKVKFNRDIKGLEADYRRYKDLKNQLLLLRK